MRIAGSSVRVIVLGAVIVASVAAIDRFFYDAVTVDLDGSGFAMRYVVHWGLRGMEETFEIHRRGQSSPVISGDWLDVYEKPYNAGGTIYGEDGRNALYIRMSEFLYSVDLDTLSVDRTCARDGAPPHKDLTPPITGETSPPDDAYGVRKLYIDRPAASRLGSVGPVRPIASSYYGGLGYFGRFGVVDGGVRGSGVGFSPAGEEPEPKYSLDTTCG